MRIRNLIWVPALGALVTMGACNVEQTREGEAPEVNVEGGQVPAYDVDAPDVVVTEDTQQVVTPDIEVTPPRD